MTGRSRPAGAVLRSRLWVVLALGALVPALLAAAVVGWWLPRHQRSLALDAAGRDALSASVALRATCQAVDAAATSAARQVQQYATGYGSIPRPAAEAAARAAVRSRPDAAVAVFDADWRPLALEGVPAGQGPASAGGYAASCRRGVPGRSARAAGLAEVKNVRTARDGLVGHLALWVPLDPAALRGLRAGLRAGLGDDGGGLAVLGRDGRVLASAGNVDGLAAAVEQEHERLDAPGAVAVRGVAGRRAYAIRPAGPGLPVRLAATAPVRGPGTVSLLAAAALLLGLLALLPARRLAGRLSAPVDDELELAAVEVEAGHEALAQTFSRFGQALEHTHDLERLLDTVAAFLLDGTGAAAGVVLLTDDSPGRPEPEPGTVAPLRARGRAARPDGDPAAVALAVLPAFAEAYYRELTAPGSTAVTVSEPRFDLVPGAGAAAAVPIRSADRLVGVLALAMGEGGGGFEATVLPRVRSVADHVGTAVANVRLHEEVRRLSVTDPLTGVGNVRQLDTTLSRELAGAIRFDRPLTVLMLDLDHFKRVNDTLGHQFGDVVLREFAQRLLGCVREVDTVTRYGGEEFAVVLRDTDVDGGRIAAQRVLAQVRQPPFRHGDLWQSVTASIGVAAFPQHGRSAAELLHAADAALYAAKRGGRDRYHVAGPPAPGTVAQAAG